MVKMSAVKVIGRIATDNKARKWTVQKYSTRPLYKVMWCKTNNRHVTELGQEIEYPTIPEGKKSQISSEAPVTKTRVKKVLDTLRGQRAIARDYFDGLYYQGTVVKCTDSKQALVQFTDKSQVMVPLRLIIPTGGAIPSPSLHFGDYVLVRVINTETDLECYVPGIMQVPPRSQGNQAKFYTILMYNGQKSTTMRSYLVKISKSRFEFTILYIAEVQNVDRERVRATMYSSPRRCIPEAVERPVRAKSAKWRSRSTSSSRSRSSSGSRLRSRSNSQSSSSSRNSSRSNTPQKAEVERSKEISTYSRSGLRSRSKSPQRSRSRSDGLQSTSSDRTEKPKSSIKTREADEENVADIKVDEERKRRALFITETDIVQTEKSGAIDVNAMLRENRVVVGTSQSKFEELQEQLKKQKERQKKQQQKLKKQMMRMKQMKKKMKKEKEEHSSLLRQILYRQKIMEPLHKESTKEPGDKISTTKPEDMQAPRKSKDDKMPLDERALPSLLQMRRLLPPLIEHEAVLARWADQGWYFRAIVSQDCGDFSYLIEDSTGSSERIWREDIISDKDDAGSIIQPKESVVALHPRYSFGYAPGIVLEVYKNLWMLVRFFDGEEGKLPREEVYRIPVMHRFTTWGCFKTAPVPSPHQVRSQGNVTILRPQNTGAISQLMLNLYNLYNLT